MDNDDFNQIDSNVSTVTALLEARGISWGTYQEDMPYTGYEGFSWLNQSIHKNDYVRKHNPPMIYNENTTPARLSYQKNFTQFYADLKDEQLPQWMFITPNMTDDGHDSSVTVGPATTPRHGSITNNHIGSWRLEPSLPRAIDEERVLHERHPHPPHL